jgi:ribosomal protein S18 acetylase RimI-like enzyme
MIIKEITDMRDVDLLLSIVETYSYTAEEMETIKTQMLAELSEAGDNRHIFVGREDDAVVAFIEIILRNADKDPDLANGREIAHLHNLRVRNDLQGTGIGRQMMAFAEDIARQMGKASLTLGVDDSNGRAVNLYKQLGYVVFKEEPGRFPEEKALMMKKQM